MKTILVATDFSEYADYAVSSAASIAKQTGAQLILLHVVNRPLNSDDDSYENYHQMPGYDLTITNVKTKLSATLKRHGIENAKVLHELRYDVFKTILKHADRHKVDLIVMGAYGSMGTEKPLIGSNTERVLLQAEMPVLVVKEKIEEFNVENMVFASEFYGEVYNVFPKMKMILDLFQTNIHLLKVNTPSHFQRTQDSMKLMTEFSNEFGLKACTKNIYNDLTVEDGILNFTESINADLIAITPDGLWRLAHVFSKNITDKLMKRSVRVILSMKTHQPVRTPTEIFYTEEYKRYRGKD
jgi:nucleotide-binding universal stress UspA family protein